MPSSKDEPTIRRVVSRNDDEAPVSSLDPPATSAPSTPTTAACMPPAGGLSCQNLPNDAADTIKEVLGWYGLQENPPSSIREDDGLDPNIVSKVKIESPSLDGPMTPLDLTSDCTSPNISSEQSSACSSGVGTSGAPWGMGHRKLIGMRFLFPPLSDDLNLLEKARIWVARHEHKYFVGWNEDDLKHIDPLLRPLTSITPETYKLHMNRSEYCRNVKLKYCLESDSEWARDFQRKLSRPSSEGGFTGLCQAKIAAAELWRKYSENYRSHQARYPNPKSKVRTKSWPQDSKEGVKRPTPEECEEGEEEEVEKRSRVITMEPKDLSSHSNGSSECSSMSAEKDCVSNKLNIAELSLQGMAACPSPVYYGLPMHGFPFVPSPYMPPIDLKPGGSPKHTEKNSEYKRSERGLSFLFPSLSDHNLSLLDKVRITVLRHKNNYFLGWAEEDLVKVDPLVRPKMRITHELYKEYCHRNAMKYDSNLQFAMESEEEWAVEFRSKLLKPPSDGGFSSLCEVKLEAGRLWREYSGKYRMHNIVKWQMDLNTAKPQAEQTPHPALDVKPDISLLGGSLHRSASLDQLMPPSNHIVRGHKRSRSSVCSSPASSSLTSPSSSSDASKHRSTPPARVQSPEYRETLFVPLPRHLSVAEQLVVWLERHKNAYFLGQTQENLLRVNDLVRPTMVVTEEVFKHFIPESMVDVLNKIELIMQRDEGWARAFQDRVHKPVGQGGFSSFEEALTEAVVLWHSHTPPNNTSGKQKDILFDKWIKHQKNQMDSYTNDIWVYRSELRDLCRDDPTQSLHTKLQPYLPLLRHKLGADYHFPATSSECVVDLVLSVLQTNTDVRLKTQ